MPDLAAEAGLARDSCRDAAVAGGSKRHGVGKEGDVGVAQDDCVRKAPTSAAAVASVAALAAVSAVSARAALVGAGVESGAAVSAVSADASRASVAAATAVVGADGGIDDGGACGVDED